MRIPLYFGCGDQVGHYLWTPSVRRIPYPFRQDSGLPSLDGGFCPPLPCDEGLAKLVLLPAGLAAIPGEHNAWLEMGPVTVLAFWDRSVDRRPGSHSTFLLPGDLDFGDALDAARDAFPWVFDRQDFSVVPWRGGR